MVRDSACACMNVLGWFLYSLCLVHQLVGISFLHRLAEEVASVQRELCHAATSSYTNVEMTAVGSEH